MIRPNCGREYGPGAEGCPDCGERLVAQDPSRAGPSGADEIREIIASVEGGT